TTLDRSAREITDRFGSLSNIIFNIPDLNVKHNVNGVNVNLQAYKVNDVEHKNQWVSIGEPVLVKHHNGSIYQFNTENIFFQLELLSDDQQKALIDAAKMRNRNITQAAIHLIPLQSITCEATFYSNGNTIELRGRARNLNRYLVNIRIPCLENSEERRHFNARIKKSDPIEWDCTFTADGKEKFVNRIEITAQDIEDASIDHDLFGPQDEVYMTRKQMTLFSQQIRNNLEIEENYELDEKFDEKLVEQLISVTSSTFQYVPIDQALEKLSKFGFSQKDLEPDEIKRTLSDEMSMVKVNRKQSISTKSDERQTNEDENEYAGRGGAELSISSLFSTKANGEVLKKNRLKWEKTNMSVMDQLNEMNKDNQIHTKYEWDGLATNGLREITQHTLKNINERLDALDSSISLIRMQLTRQSDYDRFNGNHHRIVTNPRFSPYPAR
uniref:Uncharacterized protein n=1 Tax=Romanomermis culicivorax TaxID=13658 RepID=A0A915JVN1_ROMCU